MKQRYHKTHALPAPVLYIRLALPGQAWKTSRLLALVDTGADLVIVPSRILNRLRSEEVDYVRIRGQWNEPRAMQVHTLDIAIGAFRYPAINVVADDRGDEVILGRNLLNKLVITLDGPGQETEVRV